MSESEITELEEIFPTLAGEAFMAARKATLDAGLSVLESDNGVISEVFPDGRRVEHLRVEPPTPIAAGTKVNIG